MRKLGAILFESAIYTLRSWLSVDCVWLVFVVPFLSRLIFAVMLLGARLEVPLCRLRFDFRNETFPILVSEGSTVP